MACKTLRHSAEGVRAQLEESLALLRCDRFDLYQLHAVTDLDELDARAGAVEAILPRPGRGAVPMGGHHRPRAVPRRPPTSRPSVATTSTR